MTELQCEWCGEPRSPKQKNTDTPKCRAARWRWLNDVRGKSGAPPEAPLWPGSPLHGRMGEEARSNTAQVVEAAAPRPRSGDRARSGAQISFRKAVDVLAETLITHGAWTTDDQCRERAELAMATALSPKQRARLEARLVE